MALAGALLLAWACGPRHFTPPAGPGTPLLGYDAVFAEATRTCRGVRSFTAEIGLSGRVAGSRVRGRVLAGLAEPASLRLIGLAPFGRPVFEMAARPDEALLVLHREGRVVIGSAASEILEALTGVALGPDDLRAVLTGCVTPDPQPLDGRAYRGGWLAIELEPAATAYLREVDRAYRLRGATAGDLRIEYLDFAAGLPRRIALRSVEPRPPGRPAVDLTLTLSGIETNTVLPADAFSLDVPAGALPITLDELRRATLLGDAKQAK